MTDGDSKSAPEPTPKRQQAAALQSGGKPPHSITLISRVDCHLCEEMAAIVEQVAPRFGAQVEVRDVDADPELLARYSDEVPVLLIDGRKAFKYRVTARDLERRLAAPRPGPST